MTYIEFLKSLLDMNLTMNELSILLELAEDDFTRGNLLNDSSRCPTGTYSAPALTKTLKSLLAKNPAIISSYIDSQNKIAYRLVNKCKKDINPDFEHLLKAIRYSRVLTVNTIRTALALLINDNKISTARFLSIQLDLDPDYVAAIVLPRMLVIGLIKPTLLTVANSDANYTSSDSFPLHAVCLDINWKGSSDITLL